MSLRIQLSHQVSAPPERVFAALTDVDRIAEWLPGHVRVERLTDGPVRVGSKWRETRKVFKKDSTEEFEVVAMEAPWRLGLRCDGTKGTSGRGEYLFTYRMSPEGDRTRVHVDAEIRGMGPFMSLFGWLVKGMFRKMMAKDLDALSAHLAETAPQPAGAA